MTNNGLIRIARDQFNNNRKQYLRPDRSTDHRPEKIQLHSVTITTSLSQLNIDYKIFAANKEGLAFHIEMHQATNEGGGPRWFLFDLRQSKLRFNTRKENVVDF